MGAHADELVICVEGRYLWHNLEIQSEIYHYTLTHMFTQGVIRWLSRPCASTSNLRRKPSTAAPARICPCAGYLGYPFQIKSANDNSTSVFLCNLRSR